MLQAGPSKLWTASIAPQPPTCELVSPCLNHFRLAPHCADGPQLSALQVAHSQGEQV
jgi:hypothetical protein